MNFSGSMGWLGATGSRQSCLLGKRNMILRQGRKEGKQPGLLDGQPRDTLDDCQVEGSSSIGLEKLGAH